MTARETTPANPSVLLFDAKGGEGALLFENPHAIIETSSLAGVRESLRLAEEARAQGDYCAGYIAYEAGYAFEPKLADADVIALSVPLVWFGVFKDAHPLSPDEARQWLAECGPSGEAPHIHDLAFDTGRQAYDAAFGRVQEHLAKGDIYQANLTMRARFRLEGNPAALFADLIRRQPVGHAAYVDTGASRILSLSPELFLERKGSTLRTRPMKGTAKRGRTMREDRRIARNLAADAKSQAENVMIVDLMRNDISRVTEAGSVHVPELYSIETYRTLFQMTSTVEGCIRPDVNFPEIVENLFPCGSITGAPKLSAMSILRDLETSPRGVYTGSIGYLAPGGDFRFNVAIRTLVIRADGTGEAGTGSGVVFDSGATPEYDECFLKLRFMTEEEKPFGLIETLRWTPQEGYFLLSRHLDRLGESAAYFGFDCDLETVEGALAERALSFSGERRVRLELAAEGTFELTDAALTGSAPAGWRVAICDTPVSADDAFLYHKTTRRAFFDDTRKALCEELGVDEVLFVNEEGFLTEGSYTSLFIERDGRLLTPALRHGLLPGTFRAALLETGRAIEANLTPADLANAEVFLGNSVRGLIRADVLRQPFAAEAAE
ncbi:aminodeoxychorismate synthase component I [Rhizobiales bacterium]|uniref:aminodeoxychorismate synthase component I n=1 Tax=Hongsoonwoonella zoysiae TaxID=2821844 RepID=UPI001560C09D|nr:aminodeoxychorismate synthase component I [Hongsoonwoonella zoysiae]NRG16206.1 aminodeoxychorismate synthase component I [Hongsoonwoonella zoysiae]